jgi:hypothetical protein
MACIGVRVERPVRLVNEGTVSHLHFEPGLMSLEGSVDHSGAINLCGLLEHSTDAFFKGCLERFFSYELCRADDYF